MTLVEVIRKIEVIASSQPSVNMVVENDVFRLNAKANARYGVFAWTQGLHSASLESGMVNYYFTFFYVDRLRNDKSNEIEIQSTGMQTIRNIIGRLVEEGLYVEQSYNYRAFNQRFLDECAGVFCNVIISVPLVACADILVKDIESWRSRIRENGVSLSGVIRLMEHLALSQPPVRMVVQNDVFRLNAKANARYGVFAWTQGQHTGFPDSGFVDYAFTMFYVDRLKNDLSNQIEIQSAGVQTLANIIRTMDEAGVFSESEFTLQVFNQRFMDECAGVFCNVTFSAPAGSVCPEAFGDFNEDFNDDFLIY